MKYIIYGSLILLSIAEFNWTEEYLANDNGLSGTGHITSVGVGGSSIYENPYYSLHRHHLNRRHSDHVRRYQDQNPNDAVKIVSDFTRELSSLLGTSFDKLGSLKMIAEKSGAFLSLLTPVGSLVATCLTTVLPETSEEMIAIKQLTESMDYQSNKKILEMRQSITELNKYILLGKYDDEVRMKLAILNEIFQFALNLQKHDTQRTRKNRLNALSEACKSLASKPSEILTFFYQQMYRNCVVPTRQHISIFLRLKSAFDKLENDTKNSDTQSTEYRNRKEWILQHFGGASNYSEEYTDSIASKIEQLKTLPEVEIIEGLYKIQLHDLGDNNQFESCILNEFLSHAKYQRKPLQLLAEIVRKDIIMAETMAMICVCVENYNDATSIRELEIEIKDQVDTIVNYMYIWIDRSLELSWPKYFQSEALRSLGGDPVTEEKYNEIAVLIRSRILHLGHEGFNYNVVVMPAWEENVHFYLEANESTAIKILNVNDVHIFIFRFMENSSERLISAKKWFRESNLNIVQIIHDHMYLYKLSDLAHVLNTYQAGGMVNPDRFHAVLYMKRQPFWGGAAIIAHGITDDEIADFDGRNTYYLIYYYANEHLFSSTYLIKVFLFI